MIGALAISGVSMARRGRKRVAGARERNGKPKRADKAKLIAESVRIAREMPHRQGLRSNDKSNELAESSLGRLRLTRMKVGKSAVALITASQLAAGEAFARTVDRYRSVIEGPRPVRSLTLASGDDYPADEDAIAARFDCPSAHADPIELKITIAGKSLAVRQWPCQLEGETCACRDRQRRYERLYEAVAGAGRRALMAVIKVTVRGEDLPSSELVYLRAGLDAAKRELGLTDMDR